MIGTAACAIGLSKPAFRRAYVGPNWATLVIASPSGAGLGRESLYKALSGQGNPSFGTILKVIHALGLRLEAHPGSPTVAHA